MRRPIRRGKPFEEWCDENGERGARLFREYHSKKMKKTEVSYGSQYKALWKCEDCKHKWRAVMGDRTRSVEPRGCPKCCLSRGQGCYTVVSKRNNFHVWCEKNGERGKKLLLEYVDPDKKPTELTKGSRHKAMWKCQKCTHAWGAMVCNRTKSDKPTGCLKCHLRARQPEKRNRGD